MNAEWRSRYEAGIEAARQTGRVALGYFETVLDIEIKGDASPVTIADRNAEESFRRLMGKQFPQDGFLGEEFGDAPGTSGYRWIIDPVDGTRSFVRGIPLWGTLIGLEHQGELIAGMVYMPVWDVMYHALRGEGAYRNGQRIHVSSKRELDKSLVLFSSPSYFIQGGKETEMLRLLRAVDKPRGYGDFYGMILVAQGSADVMLEFGCHPWDLAGPKVVVEEAGGRFTDWQGVSSLSGEDVLISNGHLHEAAMQLLNA